MYLTYQHTTKEQLIIINEYQPLSSTVLSQAQDSQLLSNAVDTEHRIDQGNSQQ